MEAPNWSPIPSESRLSSPALSFRASPIGKRPAIQRAKDSQGHRELWTIPSPLYACRSTATRALVERKGRHGQRQSRPPPQRLGRGDPPRFRLSAASNRRVDRGRRFRRNLWCAANGTSGGESASGCSTTIRTAQRSRRAFTPGYRQLPIKSVPSGLHQPKRIASSLRDHGCPVHRTT